MQSHSAGQRMKQHISKWNYEISVVQEIHISRLELQRCSLGKLALKGIGSQDE
jgi:hypothetical protein